MPPVILSLVLIFWMGGGDYLDCFRGTRRQTSNPREFSIDGRYGRAIDDDDWNRFSALGGRLDEIDTGLEAILALYYSAGVTAIQPIEAERILPHNKMSELKLGAAVFQEIQILRFLGNTAAVSRHEGVLKFITDRKNVTRAEIEKYYRDGIRSLVSDIVDEEFGKISFKLDTGRAISYNAVLMRNPSDGQFILSYGGVETNGETRTVTGNSADALSREMRDGKNKADFTQLSIDQIRAQAALIPAVALSDAALDEVKNILTAFYTNPSNKTYDAVKEMYVLFERNWAQSGKQVFEKARTSCGITLSALNAGLAQKVFTDARSTRNITTLTKTQQQRLVQVR